MAEDWTYDGPPELYLQPVEDADADGRTWCKDAINLPSEDRQDQTEPTDCPYVRGDKHDAVVKKLAKRDAEVGRFTRGDVGLQECTRDPIFLLEERRLHINHEGIPHELEIADDGDFLESDTAGHDEPVYYSISEIAERWPEHVDETWSTVSVWFTRPEAEAFAEKTHYRYTEGWRVYCTTAEGELAGVLRAHSAAPTGDLTTEKPQ